MSVFKMHLAVPTFPESLSSGRTISGSHVRVFLTTKFSSLSLTTTSRAPFRTTTIRMGGGPRTYPGGVSKWQWKRMQAKKAKQLLKARLARERQIYEMRKRAELKAAVSELERPWEVVEKAPKLFSVNADEQLKVLADRFQRPGGFDMWSEKDGPELFKRDDGLPSSRFFPKGVVHSIKPYGKIERTDDGSDEFARWGLGSAISNEDNKSDSIIHLKKGRNNLNERIVDHLSDSSIHKTTALPKVHKNVELSNGKSLKNNKFKKRRNRRMQSSYSDKMNASEVDYDARNGRLDNDAGHDVVKLKNFNADVFDLRLQKDGSYEFRPGN